MSNGFDFIGKRFGKLVVDSKSNQRDKRGTLLWLCLCDCGGRKFMSTSSLNRSVEGTSCDDCSTRAADLTGKVYR